MVTKIPPTLNWEEERKDNKQKRAGNRALSSFRDRSTQDWEDCAIEEPWGCLDSHRWYRTTVEIPPRLDGAHVEFLITTGREGQWDATNPQMLFYLNGKIVQGVDVNHREILIKKRV